MRVSHSLTSLTLGDNNLGDEGIEALSVGLKESTSLATLDLSNKYGGSKGFGPKGAAALASAIAVMSSLTQVLALLSAIHFHVSILTVLSAICIDQPCWQQHRWLPGVWLWQDNLNSRGT